MRKSTLFLFLFLITFHVFSQSLSSKSLQIGGGIKPTLKLGYPLQIFSVKVNIPSDFEATLHKYNAPVNTETLEQQYSNSVNGVLVDKLTKESKTFTSFQNADAYIVYNIKNFVILEKKTILKAPAYVIGIEAGLEIKDKNNELIYARTIKPTVNTYLVDPETSLEYLSNRIISKTFDNLYADFFYMYVYLPFTEITPYYFQYNKKTKKLDAPTETLDLFNQSTQVFNVLFEQKREDWAPIFEMAQNHWKSLLNYKESKDQDFNKKMRFASIYNLILSYYLLGDFDKAKQLLPSLKDNEVKMFGGGANEIEIILQMVDTIQESLNTLSLSSKIFEKVQSEPNMELYELSKNIFESLEFEGSATTTKGEILEGKIKILNDNPTLIDWRTIATGSALGNLMKSVDVERNTVYIETPTAKKPIKKKINDIGSFTTSKGNIYLVDKVGDASNALMKSDLSTEMRYAILKEVKKGDKISIYEENFPYNGRTFLKKPTMSDFYELPAIFSLKKSLLKYFEDCLNMVEKINQNTFTDKSLSTYISIYEIYNNFCK